MTSNDIEDDVSIDTDVDSTQALPQNVDVRPQTMRSENQRKKSEMIPQIGRQILRAKGAGNLLHADEKSKIFNKHQKQELENIFHEECEYLGSLKEKMDSLNSRFSVYQKLGSRLPVIPIGLKETSSIDFKEVLSPFIKSHYHQDPGKFAQELDQITHYRELIMEPERSENGLRALKKYYKLLNTIEKRFFDEPVHHGFRFSWSDAFTGEKHSQRSPAFEKGSLIFNFAALCSQIGAACGDITSDALAEQIRWFAQTRTNLQILQESFSHAPSRDMSSDVLGFLIRVMQTQAQESLFMQQVLEGQQSSEMMQLAHYIGGACFLSESYSKLASPGASSADDFDRIEWQQVNHVIPSSWFCLLEVKSQYYQAHSYYRLAIMLLCLSTNGRTPGAGAIEVGPLPQEGLFTDDGFLEAEVSRQLNELFKVLEPYIQLRRRTTRTRRKSLRPRRRRHRSGLRGSASVNEDADSVRPQSRIKRALSSLSIGPLGRSKSRGASDDTSVVSGRLSSLSVRSGDSAVSTTSMPNLSEFGGAEGVEPVHPPSTLKETHLLGQVCLEEALNWACRALQSVEKSCDLNLEVDFKAFISKDINTWTEQLNRVKRGCTSDQNSGSAGGGPNPRPIPKSRTRRLGISGSFSRHGSAAAGSKDTASVVSGVLNTSKRSGLSHRSSMPKAEGNDGANPWTAPAFFAAEIELPKDLECSVLKGSRTMLDEKQDPFRMLGPLKFFNAKKRWSEPYTVTLIRDAEVVYGFSIQGTGPVEILGVDADTPASENGMRTGDLVIGINGLDARFMTHNEAVAAIRFGAEGFDRAVRAQSAAAAAQNGDESDADEEAAAVPVSMPLEVDCVELTLVRPLPPTQSGPHVGTPGTGAAGQPNKDPYPRQPSVYLLSPATPTPAAGTPKSNPIKSFMHRHKPVKKSRSKHLFKHND